MPKHISTVCKVWQDRPAPVLHLGLVLALLELHSLAVQVQFFECRTGDSNCSIFLWSRMNGCGPVMVTTTASMSCLMTSLDNPLA